MKLRANRAKSDSVSFSLRPSRRTLIKKYPSLRKGRRSLDTAVEYGTVVIIATEQTRTAESAVRATRFHKSIVTKMYRSQPSGRRDRDVPTSYLGLDAWASLKAADLGKQVCATRS